MTAKFSLYASVMSALFSIIIFSNTVKSQSTFDRINRKVKEVNKVIDEFSKDEKKKSKEPNSRAGKSNKTFDKFKSYDLTGRWKGTTERTVAYDFDFLLNLSQSNNILSGTAELNSGHSYIKFRVSGRADNNKFTLYEDEVLEMSGTTTCDKLDFSGEINIVDGKTQIKGVGVNTDGLYFQIKEKKKGEYSVTDKDFTVWQVDEAAEAAKSAEECKSGDCMNGYGIKITAEGKYEGEFKDGKRNGKGRLDMYSGFYKSHCYIGDFVNDAFNGFGTQYVITDLETAKGPQYKGNRSFIYGSPGEVLYKTYEGNWVQNYPNGFGKMYEKGLPQLGVWSGWYLSERKALSFPELKNHLDTTFAGLQKCDCLTPAKIKIYASGFESVKYGIYDVETGKKIRDESELESVDKSYLTDGYSNKTNKLIFIKCYRKLHNVYTKQDEYRDESYVVSVNQETLKNYRHLPEAGDFIEVKAKEDFIYLGQYCLKSDGSGCKPVKK